MPSLVPYLHLAGTKVPEELPAGAEIPLPCRVGLVSEGRLVWLTGASTGSHDVEDAVVCLSEQAARALFAYAGLFAGKSTRFLTTGKEPPPEIAARVTRQPPRVAAPLAVADKDVARALRKAGLGHGPEDVARAREAVGLERMALIEREANGYGSRQTGREMMAFYLEEALKEAGLVAATPAP